MAARSERSGEVNRSVVVCRSAVDAAPLIDALESRGVRAVALPLQQRAAPHDGGAALSAALNNLDRFDWLVATSANGVRSVAETLASRRPPPSLRVAAVGPTTRHAFVEAGFTVDVMPSVATAADLAAAMPPAAAGEKVLAALAELASDDLADGLVAKGYTVERVEAYRMIEPRPDPATATSLDASVRAADAVIATAPSIVDRFLARYPPSVAPALFVCIGERTASRARSAGVGRVVVADEPSPEGLVRVMLASVADERAGNRNEACTTEQVTTAVPTNRSCSATESGG